MHLCCIHSLSFGKTHSGLASAVTITCFIADNTGLKGTIQLSSQDLSMVAQPDSKLSLKNFLLAGHQISSGSQEILQ